MIRRAGTAALFGFAAMHLVVLVTPALVIAAAADKGGLAGSHGVDLVIASTVIGGIHALVVWRRLRFELRHGVAFANACIAAFDALVVLAAVATGLLFAVLGGLAPEHTAVLNQGVGVLMLWIGVQLVAVGASELVRTAVVRWLVPRQRRPRLSWSDGSA